MHKKNLVLYICLVYVGSYESEEKAARAHDLAALKYWGPGPNAKLNFSVRILDNFSSSSISFYKLVLIL